MGRALGFVSLLIVLAIGAYIYTQQIKAVSPAGSVDPKATVNLVGVQGDLLTFAKVEQQHFASDGRYFTIPEMRNAGDTAIPADSRGPYVYSIDTRETTFTATATYQGIPPSGVPRVMRVGPDSSITTEQ